VVSPANSADATQHGCDDRRVTTEMRPAVPDDARDVAEVRAAGWRAAYRDLVPAAWLAAMDPAADAERYRTAWTSGATYPRTAVAVVEGAVVGFVTWAPYAERPDHGGVTAGPPADGASAVGELRALYVHPDHWGRAAGHLLLSHALIALAGASLAPVRLWTFSGNARARRFYERAGFRADGASVLFPVGGAEVPGLRYTRP
jgi:GNAT superfamily N-acetyltransferase